MAGTGSRQAYRKGEGGQVKLSQGTHKVTQGWVAGRWVGNNYPPTGREGQAGWVGRGWVQEGNCSWARVGRLGSKVANASKLQRLPSLGAPSSPATPPKSHPPGHSRHRQVPGHPSSRRQAKARAAAGLLLQEGHKVGNQSLPALSVPGKGAGTVSKLLVPSSMG